MSSILTNLGYLRQISDELVGKREENGTQWQTRQWETKSISLLQFQRKEKFGLH